MSSSAAWGKRSISPGMMKKKGISSSTGWGKRNTIQGMMKDKRAISSSTSWGKRNSFGSAKICCPSIKSDPEADGDRENILPLNDAWNVDEEEDGNDVTEYNEGSGELAMGKRGDGESYRENQTAQLVGEGEEGDDTCDEQPEGLDPRAYGYYCGLINKISSKKIRSRLWRTVRLLLDSQRQERRDKKRLGIIQRTTILPPLDRSQLFKAIYLCQWMGRLPSGLCRNVHKKATGPGLLCPTVCVETERRNKKRDDEQSRRRQ